MTIRTGYSGRRGDVPFPHAGAVTIVPGVVLYARGRPPATNSGRDGVPPA
jgi:hypothetical protein